MNNKMKLTAVGVLSVGSLLAACSGSDTTAPTTTTTTTTATAMTDAVTTGTGGTATTTATTSASGGGGAGGMMEPPPVFPAAPKLGVQIDRMGRPAINTVGSKTFGTPAARDLAETAYNAASDPATWVAMFKADIAKSLAVLDALDKADNANAAMAGCGNQVGVPAATKHAAGAYDLLAGVLADDRLWVKLTAAKCGLYLAVEANALEVVNDNCGGRSPTDDVIDESYSLLSGAFDFANLAKMPPTNPFLFGDTIPVDPATKTAAEGVFPYFAAKKN